MTFNEIRAIRDRLRKTLDAMDAGEIDLDDVPNVIAEAMGATAEAITVIETLHAAGTGAWAVVQERARQQASMQAGGEALDRMHDAEHNRAGELGLAATSYIAAAISKPGVRRQYRERMGDKAVRHPMTGMWPLWTWPMVWDAEAFKMGNGDTEADRIRELEKAGALVAAEIDRRSAL